MPAANTDKVLKVGTPGTATTLAAPGHNIAGTSISVVSTTNWPTDTAVAFAIDQVEIVDGRETRIPGTYTEWVGVVTGPTTIASMVLAYGTDQVYPAGSLTRVYIPVSSTQVNRFADAFLAQHKQDGSHEDITADSLAVSGTSTLGAVTATSLTLSGTASAEGWSPLGDVPDTVTAKGNGIYELLFNGNDLTDTVTEGMPIRTARTVAAPDQCTSLNGTTQYYSKSSPSGMTFTDDFSVSAWVKLSSYANGTIASRYNGTSGWLFYVDASGCVILQGNNAGASNYSRITSYQSLPLNKWVHVAAQLDMSTFTATTTTSYIMIDGVDVPSVVARAGTNPTAFIQAGNLEIGTYNAGVFFTGKIAQVAIYSAKVTQATHLAAMNQGLTGSETSLISAYSFDNAITDLAATGNNLTANGSAVATTNDSPFGNSGVSTTLDYGIVMAKSFSTNTTLTVRVPEGCTIPTTGGVSSVDYSTAEVPYGFPGVSPIIALVEKLNDSNATGTNTVIDGARLTIPVVPVGRSLRITVSCGSLSSTNAATNTDMSLWLGTVGSGTKLSYARVTSGGANYAAPATIVKTFKPATPTNVELNLSVSNIGGGTSSVFANANLPLVFMAEIV